ncbi:hypothetical protein C8J57DRAFT_1304136 [Mycena rebaudengoi]|nr:hypothetical protein C8J57DRAFT_1304136 [Mycena rebaudengoi]
MGRLLTFIPVDASAFRAASSCTQRALRFVSDCIGLCVFLRLSHPWSRASWHMHCMDVFLSIPLPLILWSLSFSVSFSFLHACHLLVLDAWPSAYPLCASHFVCALAPCRPFPFRRVPRHCRHNC